MEKHIFWKAEIMEVFYLESAALLITMVKQ